MQAYLALLRIDLEQLWRSWLVRGWVLLLVLPALFLVVVAANEHESASETLAAYITAVLAPLSWLAISILSASAVNSESHVIADSFLSRSVTRSTYIWAKITSRLCVFLTVYFVVTIPLSYLMTRYAIGDTSTEGIVGGLLMVSTLFVFLATFGIALSTIFRNVQFAIVSVLLVALLSGMALQFLGLNWMSATAVLSELPETFRGETPVWEQVRVLFAFSALAIAMTMTGVWHFRRKDI